MSMFLSGYIAFHFGWSWIFYVFGKSFNQFQSFLFIDFHRKTGCWRNCPELNIPFKIYKAVFNLLMLIEVINEKWQTAYGQSRTIHASPYSRQRLDLTITSFVKIALYGIANRIR